MSAKQLSLHRFLSKTKQDETDKTKDNEKEEDETDKTKDIGKEDKSSSDPDGSKHTLQSRGREKTRQCEKRKRLSESTEREKRRLYERKRVRGFQEKWKKTYEWVNYDRIKDIMTCKFCLEFPQLANKKSTLFVGVCEGKFREETLRSHAKSKLHLKCTSKWHEVHKNPAETADSATPIQVALGKLNKTEAKRMISLFNTAYYVAINHEPFSKFEKLCELQETNKVDIGSMYRNADKCKEFVSCIAQVKSNKLEKDIKECRFFTILSDGSTDSSVTEQETVFARFVGKDGLPHTEFVSIIPLQSANADGVLTGILEGLKEVNIGIDDLKKKLVGCNFDGASVMMGKKGGVAVKLEQKVEHDIVKIHCVAHNLELAVLDSVKTVPYLKQFQETVNQIYKFYYYSPKRRREMKAIAAIIEENPVSQTGLQRTRWVASRHRAILAVMKSLPTIVIHFENSSQGKGEEASKVKGFLKEICSERFLRFLYFMCDVLQILSDLSKQFQAESLVVNDVSTKLETCILRLEELKHAKGETYQSFLDSYDKTKSVLSSGKSTINVKTSGMHFEKVFTNFLDSVSQYIDERFRSLKDHPMVDMEVFDHRVWPVNRYDLARYGNDKIHNLCEYFNTLLSDEEQENAKEEWLELKVRLSPHRSVQPVEILVSLLQSKPEGIGNILLLVQIMMTLSPSTAKCERSFSAMKKIKSQFRSTLTQNSLKDTMKVCAIGLTVSEFDSSDALSLWMSKTKTSRHIKSSSSKVQLHTEKAESIVEDPGPSTSSQRDSESMYCDLPLPPEVMDTGSDSD